MNTPVARLPVSAVANSSGDSPVYALEVRLLGGFSALTHGEPLPKLRSRQGVRLLAFLALRAGREVERSYLAGLLWPESVETDGLALLRRTLTDLRSALGEEGARLESPSRHALRLDLRGDAFADVPAFEKAAAERDTESLEGAVSLYRGSFLEGFHDDWVIAERERLEQDCLRVLEELAERYRVVGESDRAVPLLRQALVMDPLREANHRSLMAALAAGNDQAAVASAYDQLCRRLRRDLDVEPDETTRQLYRDLRQKAREKPTDSRTWPPKQPYQNQTPAASSAVPQSILTDVPIPLTRFFGREREKEYIANALADPEVRLLTVTGPGGAGKTRIAIETARTFAERFPGGVTFLPLADVRDGAEVAEVVARAVGVPPGGKDSDTLTRVIENLTARTIAGPYLLILDNLEQLISDPDDDQTEGMIARLVENIPLLTFVVTSRQALRIGGEQELPLRPLSLPIAGESPERVGQAESVALFLDRAHAIRPDFRVTPENADAIAELCRRTEGMPLALEMAAAWVRTLSPQQMLDRLSRRWDALAARRRDLPERHRSLRATLEWSYDLLSPAQREFLMSLAAFRGGWDLEAAENVLGDGALESLVALSERSLVVVEPTHLDELPRYRLLEVVREFASERFLDLPDHSTLERRYHDHYADLVKRAECGLKSESAVWWQQALNRDYVNVRAMLATRSQEAGGFEFAKACLNLSRYWIGTSQWSEAHDWFVMAVSEPDDEVGADTKAQLWNKLATVRWRMGDLEKSAAANAAALTLLESTGNYRGRPEALTMKAHLLYYGGEYDASLPVYEEALRLAREHEPSGIPSCLGNLGVWHVRRGNPETARGYLEEQVAIRRGNGDRAGLAITLGNLGDLMSQTGDTEGAQKAWAESLSLSRLLGDLLNTSYTLNSLAGLARRVGDRRGALTLYQESLQMRHEMGARWDEAVSLEAIAGLLREIGEFRPALRLYAAASVLRDAVGTGEFAPDPADIQATYEGCAARWGEAVAVSTQAEGRTLPLDTIVSDTMALRLPEFLSSPEPMQDH